MSKISVLLLIGCLFSLSSARAATYTVTTTADAGANSLRDAISQANASTADDAITFAIPATDAGCTADSLCTLALTGGELAINAASTAGKLTISNLSGASKLIISGNNQSRIFFVDGDLTLDGISVTSGNGRGTTNTVFNNKGGGIWNGGTLKINNSIVTGNSADSGGGGIYNEFYGRATLTNSTISNNTAASGGGGISNSGAMTVLIMTNSTLSGNLATGGSGGGVSNNGTMMVANSTISKNAATYYSGGGIVSTGTMTITNSTISSNLATYGGGGGVFVYGDTRDSSLVKTNIRNTIIASNTATNGQPDFYHTDDTFTSNGNNLIGNAADTGTLTTWQASDILNQPARLAPLGNYGSSSTQTRPPRTNSPAVNAGNNCVLTNNGCGDNNAALTTDQRGLPRPAGSSSVDIGAVELQSTENFVSKTVADFDGDGTTDFSVFRPSNNVWYLLNSQSGFAAAVQFGLSSDQLVPADYDGDGKTDIAVYRSGTWYILQSSTSTVRYAQFGLAEDKPRPGDFDGDGKADIAVYRPSSGVWYCLNSSNNQFAAIQFGLPEDVPLIADFDGDGKTDIAVWRPSNGVWYWLQSTDASFRSAQFGLLNDVPVVGDYDGDGKSDLAVYRPSNGVWYVQRSQAGFTGAQIGQSGDRAAPGDFDGDGKTDIAVYRNGNWQVLHSNDNKLTVDTNFGLASDAPLPSAFQP